MKHWLRMSTIDKTLIAKSIRFLDERDDSSGYLAPAFRFANLVWRVHPQRSAFGAASCKAYIRQSIDWFKVPQWKTHKQPLLPPSEKLVMKCERSGYACFCASSNRATSQSGHGRSPVLMTDLTFTVALYNSATLPTIFR